MTILPYVLHPRDQTEINTLERYMMKNLILVDAESVEGAEARERDRQLADPVVRQHQLLLLHVAKVNSRINPSTYH